MTCHRFAQKFTSKCTQTTQLPCKKAGAKLTAALTKVSDWLTPSCLTLNVQNSGHVFLYQHQTNICILGGVINIVDGFKYLGFLLTLIEVLKNTQRRSPTVLEIQLNVFTYSYFFHISLTVLQAGVRRVGLS